MRRWHHEFQQASQHVQPRRLAEQSRPSSSRLTLLENAASLLELDKWMSAGDDQCRRRIDAGNSWGAGRRDGYADRHLQRRPEADTEKALRHRPQGLVRSGDGGVRWRGGPARAWTVPPSAAPRARTGPDRAWHRKPPSRHRPALSTTLAVGSSPIPWHLKTSRP